MKESAWEQAKEAYAIESRAITAALQTALIEETGFCNEQFAVIHPGGAVGERLNHKG